MLLYITFLQHLSIAWILNNIIVRCPVNCLALVDIVLGVCLILGDQGMPLLKKRDLILSTYSTCMYTCLIPMEIIIYLYFQVVALLVKWLCLLM